MSLAENITLGEALLRYKSKVSILKKGFKQECFRVASLCKSFLAEKPTNDITSVDIATYRDLRLASKNLKTGALISPSTVRLEMSLLSNLFDIGKIEWGICSDNPVTKVRKPKSPPGRTRRVTPREERLIFRYANAHVNQEFLSIIILAIDTAMRQGEILSLGWEHINLKTRIAHLPTTKNGEARDIPLSLKARDAIIRLGVKSEGKIFSYTSSGLKSTWRVMNERLGIKDLHFHDLRHEAISRLWELGTLDIMEIAAISGHKSLSMLKRYTHLKAHKLVSKLEGRRSKAKQEIINHMVPYPAKLIVGESSTRIVMLDFDDLEAIGESYESAVEHAQIILMRRIIQSIRDSSTIPKPDEYLELQPLSHIIMVDPLGCSLAA